MGNLDPVGPRVVRWYEYTTNDRQTFAISLQELNGDLCVTPINPVDVRASQGKPRRFQCRRLYCFRVDPESGRVITRGFVVDTFPRAMQLVTSQADVIVGGVAWTPYRYRGEYNA